MLYACYSPSLRAFAPLTHTPHKPGQRRRDVAKIHDPVTIRIPRPGPRRIDRAECPEHARHIREVHRAVPIRIAEQRPSLEHIRRADIRPRR